MRRTFTISLILLAGSFLLAGKFWEDNDYLEWTEKQALQLLQESPWAQVQTYSEPLPTGAGVNVDPSRPREQRIGELVQSRQYFIRFQSAAPVRMALARLQLLADRVNREAAEEFVQTPPFDGKMVIMLRPGSGQDPTEFHNVTTALLENSTYLLLAKSKRKIYLEEYYPPGGPGGIEAIFVFPREENGNDLVTLEEKEIRFISRISSETRLNRRFKLKNMVFQGKLEI